MPGPIDAGRPVSPTIHPRTKPEATEFALRNRGTSDWFRHDGKNVEGPPPAPNRLATKNATDIAQKNKGEPDQWFQHKGTKEGLSPTEANGAQKRVRSNEAKQISDKIKGREEAWFKMEDNAEYHTPRPKSRLTAPVAEEFKEKGKGSAGTWYKHEHGPDDQYTPPKPKTRTPGHNQEAHVNKSKGQGTPEWYKYEKSPEHKGSAAKARGTRVTGPNAEGYQERNHGSAKVWFGHDSTPVKPQACLSPRITSAEGQENARKWQEASGVWFSHDANVGFTDASPNPRCRSDLARDMLHKSRGGEMQRVMKFDSEDSQGSTTKGGSNIKPEAREIAKKNVEGMMNKYLNQEENKDYQSARPEPRVKPEAKQTLEKNKGVMNEVMDGYLDSPVAHNKRRVRPEAEGIKSKNKGQLGTSMSDEGTPSMERPGGGRGVTSEGKQYAERNKGTLGDMMAGVGKLEVTGKAAPRLKSAEAEANAERHKGSMGGIFKMQQY